jgi:hypothetical protein
VNLLRASFVGVNARFHLVGFYTLLFLLVQIVAAEADDSPEWGLLSVIVWIVSLACTFGILGMVYMAAAGRPAGRPRFIDCVLALFLPLLWLQFKVLLIVFAPIALGLVAWHAAFAPGVALETWAPTAMWWIEPLADAGVLFLMVYCTPVAIRAREQRAWGRPVRDGLALFRSGSGGAAFLLVPILLAVAVGAASHFAEPQGKEAPVPGVVQGLALLLTSWLTLVGIYGGSLLVQPPLEDTWPSGPDGTRPAPGPPA